MQASDRLAIAVIAAGNSCNCINAQNPAIGCLSRQEQSRRGDVGAFRAGCRCRCPAKIVWKTLLVVKNWLECGLPDAIGRQLTTDSLARDRVVAKHLAAIARQHDERPVVLAGALDAGGCVSEFVDKAMIGDAALTDLKLIGRMNRIIVRFWGNAIRRMLAFRSSSSRPVTHKRAFVRLRQP